MKAKRSVKILIDLLMTATLIFLMAYQVTGAQFHEWLGAGMLVLFLCHNALNLRWYGALFRGKYTAVRVLRTVTNLAALLAMLCLAASGIVMSRHVFAFLPIHTGTALARVVHLSGAYWGFTLMSIHLGLHWGIVVSMDRKTLGGNVALVWVSRVCAAAVAGYGAFCFCRADIVSYLFLTVKFAFLDYEKSAFLILTEHMAMMGCWVFISYYAAKALGKSAASKRR